MTPALLWRWRHEQCQSVAGVAPADRPGENQLRIGVECGPRPNGRQRFPEQPWRSQRSSAWRSRMPMPMMAYDDFRDKIAAALRQAQHPLTWTEIRTSAGLPQLYPYNHWVRRLENDIGL